MTTVSLAEVTSTPDVRTTVVPDITTVSLSEDITGQSTVYAGTSSSTVVWSTGVVYSEHSPDPSTTTTPMLPTTATGGQLAGSLENGSHQWITIVATLIGTVAVTIVAIYMGSRYYRRRTTRSVRFHDDSLNSLP